MTDVNPPQTDGPGDAARNGPAGSDPDSALVQVDDELAILYGAEVPAGLEVLPFTLMNAAVIDRVGESIALVSGLGNVAAQGATGLAQAQGLVRLAPETLKALETSRPLMSGGWNLGTLASEGKFVAQVRWLPAGTAGAASVVASLGPAIALVAIQVQLASISRLVRQNLELTGRVLEVVRNEQYAGLVGTQAAVVAELERARDLGSVPDSVWTEVRGLRREIEADAELFRRHLSGHLRDLRAATSNKDRLDLVARQGVSMIADAEALIRVHSTRLAYFALRAGHQLQRPEGERDDHLVQSIVDEARETNASSLEEARWLLGQLDNEFGVIAKLPGKRAFILGKERRAATDVQQIVRQLQTALDGLLGRLPVAEAVDLYMPTIKVFKFDMPDDLMQLLPFRLTQDEELHAAGACAAGVWDRTPWQGKESHWIVLTSRRILLLKQDEFRRFAAVEVEYLMSDLRFVRLRDRGKGKGPALDLVTRSDSLTIYFYPWAETGPQREEVEALTDVLRAFMHIPVDERRDPPSSRLPLGPAAQGNENEDA